jgi:D-glycero-D-manno-heptose 1,7-bisphosphate phosphatase
MRPIVFLDKDGTIIENIPFNVDTAKVRWLKGAPEGIRRLAAAGFAFAVISNQPGIAYGEFKEELLQDIHRKLDDMMKHLKADLLGFYYCPHHPQGSISAYAKVCDCRKPKPGLILRAAQDIGADLSCSWMIGDILDDVEAGNRAGVETVLLNNGHETVWQDGPYRYPSIMSGDIEEAAEYILSFKGKNYAKQHMARLP